MNKKGIGRNRILLLLLLALTFVMSTKTVSAALAPRKVKLLSAELSPQGVISVRWEEAQNLPGYEEIEGYRIQYSESSAFTSSVSRYVSDRKITMENITGVNPSGKYYVRVCAYGYAPDMRRIHGENSDVKIAVLPGTHLKQTISGSASFTKDFVNKGTFKLGASAKGKLTYKSSNTKVVTVSSTGVCTMKGYGTATITISAAATPIYEKASKKVTVKINPAQMKITSISSSGGNLVFKWNPDSRAGGYEVQISTRKDFKASATMKGSQNKNTLKSMKVTKLKKGTRYYVRIRAFKVISGKKWYGKWSPVKNIVIK